MINPNFRLFKLINIALDICPSDIEKNAFHKYTIEVAHESSETQVRLILSALLDGVTYGNWPR
jgi:uncharacterized protein YaeQ